MPILGRFCSYFVLNRVRVTKTYTAECFNSGICSKEVGEIFFFQIFITISMHAADVCIVMLLLLYSTIFLNIYKNICLSKKTLLPQGLKGVTIFFGKVTFCYPNVINPVIARFRAFRIVT